MIGIFNDNYPPIMDGVAMTARNYAYWLHQKGEEVCVVTPYAPDAPQEEGFDVYRYASMPIPMRPPYRFGLPYIDAKFRHRLNKVPFEIVHAHCPFTSGYLALNLAHHKHHCPIVSTFHSKYRQDFDRAVGIDFVVDAVIANIVRFYNKVDEVWIPQAAVEPTLREYGYKGHIEVVENGNDFTLPYPEIEQMRASMRAELGLRPDEIMLLFVGQHIWEKNIGFILDSLALIKHMPWRMYMIGTGYAEKDIQKKICQLGMQDKITMVGMLTDRERLKRYDAASDLFLFPSLYDNAPLVVREAAAMHTPTIMLEGSTSAEVIRDGVNGFLTPNDELLYARRVQYLLEHPDTIYQVGHRASETIARSWENVVEEVILRYRDIIKAYHAKNR